MSLLSGLWAGAKMVMGLSGGAKGGTSDVMTVAKGVGNFIDEQKFTTEEKAMHNAEMVKNFGAYMQNTVSENTQRSRSRRDISLTVIRFYLVLVLASAILFKFEPEWSAWFYTLATSDPLKYLVLGIGAFFFGAHIVRAMK